MKGLAIRILLFACVLPRKLWTCNSFLPDLADFVPVLTAFAQ